MQDRLKIEANQRKDGILRIQLPEDSPAIALEHGRAVQEAIDDEEAARAMRPDCNCCVAFPETSL